MIINEKNLLSLANLQGTQVVSASINSPLRSRSDSFTSTITTDSQPGQEDQLTEVQESRLFDLDTHQVLDGRVEVFADPVLLPQHIQISCAGTLTVYLDVLNKIEKFVFLYTAMDPSTSMATLS